MKSFEVHWKDSKSYEIVSEENGKYYSQSMTWWKKGGYCIPQGRKRISKEKYLLMQKQAKKNEE